MTDPRRRVGELGERLAVRFLTDHGVQVVARNVEVGGGELDILGSHLGSRVVFEVRTITGSGDPLLAFDSSKESQVASLSGHVRAERVDLVAIRLSRQAAEVRWVRAVA